MKNFFNKFFNKSKHNQAKIDKQKKRDVEIFRRKYENYIYGVQKALKTKKEIAFLHSGHIGDIINVLPIIKEISKTHRCKFFIGINVPLPVQYHGHPGGKFFLNKKIYDMLYPLLASQKYIDKIEIFNNQDIDINFDYIICLAGIASPYYYYKYPLETLDVSINGVRNMFKLNHNDQSKFIFFSTIEVY